MRHAARSIFVSALLGVLAAAQGRAQSAEEHTVLLTAPQSQAALRESLRAELTHGGWLVVEMPAGGAEPTRAPDDVARHLHASVALRVGERRDVELWIVDPQSSSTVLHEGISANPSEGSDVLTLHVVEILRARMLKVGLSAPSERRFESAEAARADPPGDPDGETRDAPGETPRTAPEAAATPERDTDAKPRTSGGKSPDRAVDLDLGPVAAWSPGGLGVTPELSARISYVLDRTWAFGATTLLPLGGASVEEDPGTVSVLWGFGGATVERRLPYERGSVALGASTGVVVQRLSGDANAPYEGETAFITAFAALVHAGNRFDLSESLAVRVDCAAGIAAPRPVVVIADRDAARWGRPLLLLSLGLEWEAWSSRR